MALLVKPFEETGEIEEIEWAIDQNSHSIYYPSKKMNEQTTQMENQFYRVYLQSIFNCTIGHYPT